MEKSNTMIAIKLKASIHPIQQQSMKKIILPFVRRIRELEGCLVLSLFQDMEDQAIIHLYSEWKDTRTAREAFEEGPLFQLREKLDYLCLLLQADYNLVSKKVSEATMMPQSDTSIAGSPSIQSPLSFPSLLEEEDVPSSTAGACKYANSNMSEEQINNYLEKILQYMDLEKPFLDKSLTLRKFAEHLDIHPHHVSRVVNEKLGLNFSNFVNSFRVEYSKQFLIQEFLSKYTISGIGNEAGFNSRSAFYNSFKKFAGMSPGDFVNNNQLPIPLA